jgi:hypothetical protein
MKKIIINVSLLFSLLIAGILLVSCKEPEPEPTLYRFEMSSQNPLLGSVSGTPNGDYESSVLINAMANAVEGAYFTGWFYENGESYSTIPSLHFYLEKDTTLVARFAIISHDSFEIIGAPEYAIVGDTFDLNVKVEPANSWWDVHDADWSVVDSTKATISSTGLVTVLSEGTIVVRASSSTTVLAEVSIYAYPDFSSFGFNYSIASGDIEVVSNDNWIKILERGIKITGLALAPTSTEGESAYYVLFPFAPLDGENCFWGVSYDTPITIAAHQSVYLGNYAGGITYAAGGNLVLTKSPDIEEKFLLDYLAAYIPALAGVESVFGYYEDGIISISLEINSEVIATINTVDPTSDAELEVFSRLTTRPSGWSFVADADVVLAHSNFPLEDFPALPGVTGPHLFRNSVWASTEDLYYALDFPIEDIKRLDYLDLLASLSLSNIEGVYELQDSPRVTLEIPSYNDYAYLVIKKYKVLPTSWPTIEVQTLITAELGSALSVPAFVGGNAYLAKVYSGYTSYVLVNVYFNETISEGTANELIETYKSTCINQASFTNVYTASGVQLQNSAHDLYVVVVYNSWNNTITVEIHNNPAVALPSVWPATQLLNDQATSQVPEVSAPAYQYSFSSYNNTSSIRVLGSGVSADAYALTLLSNGFTRVFEDPRQWNQVGWSYVKGTIQVSIDSGSDLYIYVYPATSTLPSYSSTWPAIINEFSPVATIPQVSGSSVTFAVVEESGTKLVIHISNLADAEANAYLFSLMFNPQWSINPETYTAISNIDPSITVVITFLPENYSYLLTIIKKDSYADWASFIAGMNVAFEGGINPLTDVKLPELEGFGLILVDKISAYNFSVSISDVSAAELEAWIAALTGANWVHPNDTTYQLPDGAWYPRFQNFTWDEATETLTFTFNRF